MGYEAGKGLGKNKQGRTTIVEAHLRKGKGAVGAYGKEGNRPSKTSGKRDSEEEEAEEFIEKLHQWKKGGSAGAAVGSKYVDGGSVGCQDFREDCGAQLHELL